MPHASVCSLRRGNCWPSAHNVDVLVHLLVADAGAGLEAAHGHLGLGTEGSGDMESPGPAPQRQLDNRGQRGALTNCCTAFTGGYVMHSHEREAVYLCNKIKNKKIQEIKYNLAGRDSKIFYEVKTFYCDHYKLVFKMKVQYQLCSTVRELHLQTELLSNFCLC